jgi:hypothetical protein
MQSTVMHLFKYLLTNECLLSCIKGTVEDAETVMSFECGDDFLFEWLCE